MDTLLRLHNAKRAIEVSLGKIRIQLKFKFVPGNESRHCGKIGMPNSKIHRLTEPLNKEKRRRGNPFSARDFPFLSSRRL